MRNWGIWSVQYFWPALVLYHDLDIQETYISSMGQTYKDTKSCVRQIAEFSCTYRTDIQSCHVLYGADIQSCPVMCGADIQSCPDMYGADIQSCSLLYRAGIQSGPALYGAYIQTCPVLSCVGQIYRVALSCIGIYQELINPRTWRQLFISSCRYTVLPCVKFETET